MRCDARTKLGSCADSPAEQEGGVLPTRGSEKNRSGRTHSVLKRLSGQRNGPSADWSEAGTRSTEHGKWVERVTLVMGRGCSAEWPLVRRVVWCDCLPINTNTPTEPSDAGSQHF
jgi:hypothetical protein